jgi:tRNA dimethylallyltransferase
LGADAAAKIGEIERRGNVPILVGGTGFYLRTLKKPFFESPKTDAALRRTAKKIKEKKGAEHLHKILRRVDKVAAEKLFPRDYVRRRARSKCFFKPETFLRTSAESRRRAGICRVG